MIKNTNFMLRIFYYNFKKKGIEENFPNLIKDVYKKTTANIILNGENLKTLSSTAESK